jgi:hypothetical protein
MDTRKVIRRDEVQCGFCSTVLSDKKTEVEVKEGEPYTSYTLTIKDCVACKLKRSLGIR